MRILHLFLSFIAQSRKDFDLAPWRLLPGLLWMGALLLLASESQAARSTWSEQDHSRVRLLVAEDSRGEGTLSLGVAFDLSPDWKIYWRNPGDAGLPPSFDWSGSENVTDFALAWPTPKRFVAFGLENIGYEKEVVFPVTARVPEIGAPIRLVLQTEYLICADICVPGEARMTLDLPALEKDGQRPAADEASVRLQEAWQRVPVQGPDSPQGLRLISAQLVAAPGDRKTGEQPPTGEEGTRQSLIVEWESAAPFSGRPDMFVEGTPDHLVAAPEQVFAPGHRRITLSSLVTPVDPQGAPLTEGPLTVTFNNGAGRGLERVLELQRQEDGRIAVLPRLSDLGSGGAPGATGTPEPGAPDGLQAGDRVGKGADGLPGSGSGATTRMGSEGGAALAEEGDGDALATLALMLGTAFLGGLILNLMPCVLPVLSLKLVTVVGHGGSEQRQVRFGFIASAAGILVSFLALALIAFGLQQGGLQVGWGMQFQQPVFLTGMILLLTLFAANLWGWFEIGLPGWLADFGFRVSGGASSAPMEAASAESEAGPESAPPHRSHSMVGHFGTGVFATLLATPCSAPFVGTALSFALSRGRVEEIVAIFLAMGVGLALPYLLVALFPGIATRMPKPGAWMVILRRALGFALLATSLWLGSVLAAQRGMPAALTVGGLMAGVLALLWLRHRFSTLWLRLGMSALAVGLAALTFLAPGVPSEEGGYVLRTGSGSGSGSARASAEDARISWRAFEPDRVSALVADGKVVLIDVTADWCITCKVNKRFVLDRDSVTGRLQQEGVVAMQADWTTADPEISAYLASYGRYGIPFNIVHGPGAPEGVVLPELLTESVVLEALDRAGQDGHQARAEAR